MEKTFKFTGYISGDMECFCFAMPLADAERNKLQDLDDNRFHPGLVSVYPDRLVKHLDGKQLYEFEVTIKATPQYNLVAPDSHTTIANASTGRLNI